MPNPKEFRHLVQDAVHEPDFYVIQLIAPLPGDEHYGKTLTIDAILQFCCETGRSETSVLQRLSSAASEEEQQQRSAHSA